MLPCKQSHYVSPLAGLFEPEKYHNIVEQILSYVTNFKDRRNIALLSKYMRKRLDRPSSNGIRTLTIGPRIDRNSPYKPTDHQFFNSSPIYINDLAVADTANDNSKLETNMHELVDFFEFFFKQAAPLDTLVIVFNKLKFPIIDQEQMRSLFSTNRVRDNLKSRYEQFAQQYRQVKNATEGLIDFLPQLISHDRKLYDDRVFACLVVALLRVKEAGCQCITRSLFIRMDTSSSNVRVFNARVYALLTVLPGIEKITLDYAPPLTDAVPPKLEDFQSLQAIEIKLLQRRTLTEIAMGDENQARERFQLWLETTLKNMNKLKKFALRVLPHMALNPTSTGFSHVMLNHWQNMDDVLTMNDFFTNCPPSVDDLHFQTKATLQYIIQQMLSGQNKKMAAILKRLVVLTPSDQQTPEDNKFGCALLEQLFCNAPNIRQLIWITMRPICQIECQGIAMSFISNIKRQKSKSSTMQPMLALRYENLGETVRWLQKKKKIKTFRIINQSHFVLYFVTDENYLTIMHLQHAIMDKSLKRRNVQSLAQLHGVRRIRYSNSVLDQYGIDF